MSDPIIFHGNGGTTDGEYAEIKQRLLNNKSLQNAFKQPKNLLVLTWNTYDEDKDLDLSLKYLGYQPAINVVNNKSTWVRRHKFVAADDESRWVNLNKIVYLKDFVDNYDFKQIDYVLICDYTDIIITGSLDKIINRFEAFKCDALFNSEVNCFSSNEFKPQHDEIADKTGQPRVYLNSGCCIVKISYLKQLVDKVFELLKSAKSTDDQILYHQVYAENYPNIKIDREEKIFKCMHNNEPKSRERYFNWHLQHRKVGIGLPMLFPFIHYKFVNSFLAMSKPPNHISISHKGSLTALARNTIVDIAQQQGCDYLMFLDTDQTFPPDTIFKLLKHQKDICSGLYFERYAPYRPVIRESHPSGGYSLADYTQGNLIEVDATGGGCLLINMEVFERLEKPYFDYRIEKSGIKETFFSEDLVFCEKVRAAGYKIHVDTTVRCGHLINDYEISEKDWDGTTDFR